MELTGTDANDRQILGLEGAVAPNTAVNAADVLRSVTNYAVPNAGSILVVDLPMLEGPLMTGTNLLVKIPWGMPSGEVTCTVNGSGPYPLLLGPGMPLVASDVEPEMILSLIFDGTTFQVLNGTAHRHRDCPAEMREVNNHFCVDIDESGEELNFFNAAVVCAEAGKRLCTWAELFLACDKRTQLNLSNFTNNYEWTTSTMNFDQAARVLGNGSCFGAGGLNGEIYTLHFRCCLSR